MTKQNIIRVLSGLMFLIFFCPFFQMCSDEGIKNFPFKRAVIEETVTDSASVPVKEHIYDKVIQENIIKENEASFQQERKEFTKSGYGLTVDTFKALSEGFSANDFSEVGLYLFVAFSLIPILLLVLFILALKRKFKAVRIIGGIIILLNIICLSILSVEEILKDISQIKYGYYLFVINIIVIISLSAKLKIKTLRDGINW